jgi:hypothetical protein
MNHYDALLDDNFLFFYTDGGGGAPIQWARADDITATSGLLAGADKVDLTIDWKDADGQTAVQWTEQVSGNEMWYTTTTLYHFTIKIGDTTYIPNAGSKITFTVRNAGTNEAPKWRLVELHDLGGPSTLRATRAAAVEPTTYGKVKSLYR